MSNIEPPSTPSITPSRLDTILGRTTVDQVELWSLSPAEIKALVPHVSDRFLVGLELGHLRPFMAVVPIKKQRLVSVIKARLLIHCGASINLDTLKENSRAGPCGKPHRTVCGSRQLNCYQVFEAVRHYYSDYSNLLLSWPFCSARAKHVNFGSFVK